VWPKTACPDRVIRPVVDHHPTMQAVQAPGVVAAELNFKDRFS